jgi:alpha-D-ribose 1-methylphosphonate 5-triphosphate diphosphatase
MAAFELPQRVPSMDLAAAIRTVTLAPAEATGLFDRGAIEIGRRADLVRAWTKSAAPIVRTVWRGGRRVS